MDQPAAATEEHTWIRPMGISNIKRKRARDDTDSSASNKDGLPDKKKGRKHSIFTLSRSSTQIAEERGDIHSQTSIFKRHAAKPPTQQQEQETPDNEKWHEQLCIDWSLKSFLRISTKNPFAWSSNNLKSSEESSGTSAFVRCMDIEANATAAYHLQTTPKLDTSLGAQFHQCCLYWQHPYIPSLTLFPRDNKTNSYSTTFTGKLDAGYISGNSSSSSGPTNYSSTRFDEKFIDCMQTEWTEALRSSFHLLRLRQSPYFYVCSSLFTCLFCSAGTRDQDIHIYITPSTKGFRDSLKKEGIKFDMPCFIEDKEKTDSQGRNVSPRFPEESSSSKSRQSASEGEGDDMDILKKGEGDDDDSDEEPDKWLDDMGISQDVSISNSRHFQSETTSETKMKSTLMVIKGSEALPFFNFLINTRNMLIASSGPLAGIPPTILSPVAFHGATLQSLKVKQKKVKNESGQYFHLIEMNGPILPHMPHMLCGLLSKTVNEYKIHVNTLSSTMPLNNVTPEETPDSQNKPNAFALESLTDCGLTKAVLDVFCQCCNNCCTIKEVLHRKNCLFNWS